MVAKHLIDPALHTTIQIYDIDGQLIEGSIDYFSDGNKWAFEKFIEKRLVHHYAPSGTYIIVATANNQQQKSVTKYLFQNESQFDFRNFRD